MKIINEMIVALYFRNKDTMKFSNETAVLFISKLTFSIPIFVWLSFIVSIVDRYFFGKDLLSFLPKGKYALWPVVIIIYFIFDRITLKKKDILVFISELEEGEYFKERVWQFWIFTIIGILLTASIGYYKKWHPLP
jgi:hypothetical protein